MVFYHSFAPIDPPSKDVGNFQDTPTKQRTTDTPYLLVTGLVVIAAIAGFFALAYLFIKRKYGNMSTAVQHMQVQYNIARRAL